MDRPTFESLEPVLDEMAELIERILDSEQSSALRDALTRLSEVVGPRRSVNLVLTVDVFDEERLQALPLLTTGLTSSEGRPPHRTWGDSTPQKYVVGGEIQVVPHDRCPRCYGEWDFKFKNRSCSDCGAILGRDVKLLLDTDVCPFCEEGKVSMSEPICDRCGHQVDPESVVWG
jgi:hypothetical protein